MTYLNKFVDKRDWGYRDRETGKPKHAHTAARIQADIDGGRFGPKVQQLSGQLYQAQLDGRDELHYTSGRKAGLCMPMIDIDEHAGQTDGFELLSFLLAAYFPGAYWEHSRRGYHVYIPVRCERDGRWIPRKAMNELLVRLGEALRVIARDKGFAATIEVKGTFGQPHGHLDEDTGEVLYRCGHLAAMPRPLTQSDLDRLKHARVHTVETIDLVLGDADESIGCNGEQPSGRKSPLLEYASGGKPANDLVYVDGWTSMHGVCQWFIKLHRRVPDGCELLEAYCEAFGRADDSHERQDRANRVSAFYQKHHDPERLAGFAYHRPRLLSLIASQVTDWTIDPKTACKIRKLIPEDLAVVLFVVELVSFTPCERPSKQFGMPRARLVAMFAALARRKVIGKPRTEGKELRAILDLLVRAWLVECLDRAYQFNAGNGIGQKWTISTSHPDYAKHVMFSETVQVRYVGSAAAEAGVERVAA